MGRNSILLIFFGKIFGHIKKKQYLCTRFRNEGNMVAIAQLAEHRIVVPSVVGSSPTSHPKETLYTASFFVTSGLARKNRALVAKNPI